MVSTTNNISSGFDHYKQKLKNISEFLISACILRLFESFSHNHKQSESAIH